MQDDKASRQERALLTRQKLVDAALLDFSWAFLPYRRARVKGFAVR